VPDGVTEVVVWLSPSTALPPQARRRTGNRQICPLTCGYRSG